MAVDYRAILIAQVQRSEDLASDAAQEAHDLAITGETNHEYGNLRLCRIETELFHIEVATHYLVAATATAALSELPPVP